MTSSISCPPRYATRRRPERETFGHELGNIADALGQPLMPWQRFVADVGCEIDPRSGLPAYREVRVTIPRQSGKTTLFLSWQVHRCVARRWKHPQRSAFTAQTGKDARDKWLDELFPLIRGSKLKPLIATTGERLAINEGMGNESIKFKTGSLIRLLSTSAGSGHSKTLDQAVLDELWHDVDDRREQGLRPAMLTRRDAQLLVCSTAGTVDSVILNRKIESGRQATVDDSGFGVAYFEWSAPDDWDPDDWDSYFGFSPALCPDPPCRCAPPGESWRHTITLRELQAERTSDMPLVEFKRAYGNVMAGVQDLRWQVIPESDWRDAAMADMPRPDQFALAVTLAPDLSRAYICKAGPIGDGLFGVAVLDSRAGVSWVTDRLYERCAEQTPLAVVFDRNSAAEQIWLECEARDANSDWDAVKLADIMQSITPRDECAASTAFYNGISGTPTPADPDGGDIEINPRTVRHRDQAELTSAAAVATKKPSGSTWRWDELASDVSALKGCSEALFGYLKRQPKGEDPWIWDGLS